MPYRRDSQVTHKLTRDIKAQESTTEEAEMEVNYPLPLVLQKKHFKRLNHIWACWLSWSRDLYHLNKLCSRSFSLHMKFDFDVSSRLGANV